MDDVKDEVSLMPTSDPTAESVSKPGPCDRSQIVHTGKNDYRERLPNRSPLALVLPARSSLLLSTS